MCKLTIADGSNTEVALTPAAEPFMTAILESDDLFTPIRTSSGYVRVVVDSVDDIAPVVGSYPLNRAITLTTSNASGSSSTVKWNGFLSCESFTQTWDKGPIEIELPVISPLGVLQGIYPSAEISHLGYINFAQFLLNMNEELGLPFTYFFFPVLSEAATTLQYQFTMQNYASAIDKNTGHEVASYYEILEDICKLFGWQCIEYGTYLVFLAADVKKLEEGHTNNYQGYTVQRMIEIANGGTSVSVSYRPSFTAVIPAIGGADHSQTWLAGKKSVEVTGNLNEESEEIWEMDVLEQCVFMGTDNYNSVNPMFGYSVVKYATYKNEENQLGNICAYNSMVGMYTPDTEYGYDIKFENAKNNAGAYGGCVSYEELVYRDADHSTTDGEKVYVARIILKGLNTDLMDAVVIRTNYFYTPTQNTNDTFEISADVKYAADADDVFKKQDGALYTHGVMMIVNEGATYYYDVVTNTWTTTAASFVMRVEDGSDITYGYKDENRTLFRGNILCPNVSGEVVLKLLATTRDDLGPGTGYVSLENLQIRIKTTVINRRVARILDGEFRESMNEKKIYLNNGFSDSWDRDCGLTLARETVPDSYGVVLSESKTLPTSLYDNKWPEDAMAERVRDYYQQARIKIKAMVTNTNMLLSPFVPYIFTSNGKPYICIEQQMNWRTNEIIAGFFEPTYNSL